MKKIDIYIKLIILFKTCFIIATVIELYLNFKSKKSSNLNKKSSDLNKKISIWKKRFEFIFILLMAIFLIYLFNPRYDKSILIDGETKLVLFMLGITLLLILKWDLTSLMQK
jgi:hypothetical protein